MNISAPHRALYGTVLLMSGALIMTALGGGIFGEAWTGHWQHTAFSGLCHQDPSRSFWINGDPMAVCSRCFGIYAGFGAGWLVMPAARGLIRRIGYLSGFLLAGVIMVNAVDAAASLAGLWENTLVSRFGLGYLIGTGVVLFIGREFIQQQKVKGVAYGADRTV